MTSINFPAPADIPESDLVFTQEEQRLMKVWNSTPGDDVVTREDLDACIEDVKTAARVREYNKRMKAGSESKDSKVAEALQAYTAPVKEACHMQGCNKPAMCCAHWKPSQRNMSRCLCMEHAMTFQRPGLRLEPMKKKDTKAGKQYAKKSFMSYQYARKRGWV